MKLIKFLCAFMAVGAVSCSDTTVFTGEGTGGGGGGPLISGQFTKRVLIEDFTGTWCGNCTRVALGIENVNSQTNKAVSVGIHNGNDPYHFDGIEPLRALIYPDFPDFPLPTVRLNRTTVWTFPEPSNTQQALNLTGDNCGLGLAIGSTLENGNVNVNVKVKFAEDYSDLKLVVYMLEDNLIYNQVNYLGTYHQGQNPIQNFEHDHVLRKTLTHILGDPISESTANGSTVVKNYTMPIPSNISNPENLGFVAFVVAADNSVINVRSSVIHENQAFEQNP